MSTQNITITAISSVLHVAKNNPPGNVDDYTSENGLPNHELVFRMNGLVRTDIDGHILTNKVNTVEYFPRFSGKKRYKVLTLETGDCIDILFHSDMPLCPVPTLFEIENNSELRLLFLEAEKIWFFKTGTYYYRVMSILYKILDLLIKENEKETLHPLQKKIHPALQYISENICQTRFDYQKLAELCDMSYSYFRRLFKECMKMTLTEYITERKILYAKELLVSGVYRIGEIADLVGFTDIYYFSRVFKKVVGMSPKQYSESGCVDILRT